MTKTCLFPLLTAVFLATLGNCAADNSADDPAWGTPTDPRPFTLAFEPIEVAAGQELFRVCQSVTLNNPEPIAVNAVTMTAGPAWHHSNWFFVPEDMYQGPDGTWNCDDRDFDTVIAGLGGSVLFAMSTQSGTDEQRFQPGAALVIPPYSRVLGDVHLINASDASLATSIALDIEPIRESDIEVWLQPASFVYWDLAIPPMTTSRFSSECDMQETWGEPVDLKVHYVLPHYHGLGTRFRLETMGGPDDGKTIFDVESAIGEPLGQTLDPPVALSGARGVRFSCTYQNTAEDTVGWGLRDGEMCVALAFIEGPYKWSGFVDGGSTFEEATDGVMDYSGPCRTLVVSGT